MKIKPAESCKLDIVSLGEIMLRMDPGEGRVRTARQFRVWEGGGEYNVARGLRRCFGKRAAVVTSIADNEIGRLLEDLILNGGVDTSWINWVEYDGVGRKVRNGLNFTERGFGVRAALGTSDRGHTATAQMQPGDVDWDELFASGVRWFHTGGIFAALSESTPQVAQEAIQAAKRHGTVTSYDLNYRPSLWREFGGAAACQRVNRQLVELVDVVLGNEEDFSACLGMDVAGLDEQMKNLPVESYKQMIGQVTGEFPRLKAIATTLRTVTSASTNQWSGLCWCDGQLYEGATHKDLEIFDRVGGGDSFASGLIFGFLEFNDPRRAVDYGVAHGALAMTTPGDTSMATRKEVEAVMAGQSARASR